MVIVWAINGFHAPIDGNHFGFQRMDDKVKDGLVLSVVWRWRDTWVLRPINSVACAVGVEGRLYAGIGKGSDTQVLTNHRSMDSLLT